MIGSLTPFISIHQTMPNQRSANKVRVTVPMEKALEKAVREYSHRSGKNRVDVIKEAIDAFISQKKQKDNNQPQ